MIRESSLLEDLPCNKEKIFIFGDFDNDEYKKYFSNAEVERVGVEFECGDLYNSTQEWVNKDNSMTADPSFCELLAALNDNTNHYRTEKLVEACQETTEDLLDDMNVLSTQLIEENAKENVQFENEEPPEKPKTEKKEEKGGTWASLFSNTTPPDLPAGGPVIISENIEHHPIKTTTMTETLQLCKIESDERAKKLSDHMKTLSVNFTPHHLQLRGLVNRGNYCYILTTLQALHAVPPLSHFFKSLVTFANHSMHTSTPFTDSMIAFFDEFEKIDPRVALKKQKAELRTGVAFEPKCVYNRMLALQSTLLEKGRQEDAEEFLSFFLNGLHDELSVLQKLDKEPKQNGVHHSDDSADDDSWAHIGPKNKQATFRKTKSDVTLISEVFGGMIRSSVLQTGVKESNTLQPFFTLQLDIQGPDISCLTEALESYFVKESLHDFTCSKTKAEVEASRKMSLESLPVVLIFHLKYFVYDMTGGCQKIYKPIDIPVDLEIPKEILSPVLRNPVSLSKRNYTLSAVIYHHGKLAAGGHYTAAVNHGNPFGWVNFDDNLVRTVNANQVLGKQQGTVPYLLFYTRNT